MWSSDFGGIQKVIFDLTNEQRRNTEMHVEVLLCKETDVYKKIFSDAGINCATLGMRNATDISIARYRKLKKFFSSFDILHFHSFIPFVGFVAVRSKKKIIYTEHGNFGFGKKRLLTDNITMSIQKTFLNSKVDYMIFNSEFTKHTSEFRFGLKKVKRQVVYNGIPSGSFSVDGSTIPPEIKEKTKGKFVVGTSSRFVQVKRIDRLMEAYSMFAKNKNCCLLLCGDGPLRKYYEKMAAHLDITTDLIITGLVPVVKNYQALFDVAVFPSQGEAFGLAAVETLSLGIPAIVYSGGGGLVEIIEPICKEDVVANSEELITRLSFYYGNRNTLINEREKRIQYAGEFNIEKMSQSVFQIYKSVLNE
jgi:glycosyltransferase involved in cell wall biosynthesis